MMDTIFRAVVAMCLLGSYWFMYNTISTQRAHIDLQKAEIGRLTTLLASNSQNMEKILQLAPAVTASHSPTGTAIPQNNPAPLETMQQIGSRTQTDKIGFHAYHRFYPFFLERWRNDEINMLEIGFLHGQSYEMWLQYFKRGHVYFFEKDAGRKYPDARWTGDQGNVKDLEAMLNARKLKGKLDLIVDDGSHYPEHMKISFKYLFVHGLKPGGVYILEDIEMNYWLRGDTYGHPTVYGMNSPESMVNQLKAVVDSVNRVYIDGHNPPTVFGPEIDNHISSIFFGDNCIIISKMTLGEENRPKEYKWKDKIQVNPPPAADAAAASTRLRPAH